jgi:putative PIN family toxin of toxin-antitoxin system
MKTVVVDTNIIFSALISRNSTLGEIIISSRDVAFYTSDYMFDELKRHHEKLKKASGMSDSEIEIAKYEIFKYIRFVTLELIPEKYWREAELLVSDIDIDDIVFVALSLYLDAPLWTGDKVLYNGLRAKGFANVISTKELKSVL